MQKDWWAEFESPVEFGNHKTMVASARSRVTFLQ